MNPQYPQDPYQQQPYQQQQYQQQQYQQQPYQQQQYQQPYQQDYNQGYGQPQYGGYQRQVSFIEAIQMGFNNYVQFNGRASRSEYWWWTLFSFLAGVGGSILASVVGGWISTVISLGLFLPGLGVACRRLHDIGKAAGWICLAFIPIVGAIILIIWLCKPSEEYPNRFGEVPNMVY